jgi:hypothetical protein
MMVPGRIRTAAGLAWRGDRRDPCVTGDLAESGLRGVWKIPAERQETTFGMMAVESRRPVLNHSDSLLGSTWSGIPGGRPQGGLIRSPSGVSRTEQRVDCALAPLFLAQPQARERSLKIAQIAWTTTSDQGRECLDRRRRVRAPRIDLFEVPDGEVRGFGDVESVESRTKIIHLVNSIPCMLLSAATGPPHRPLGLEGRRLRSDPDPSTGRRTY